MHSGCEEAVPQSGEVVHGLEKICIGSSEYSLHFLAKSPTSFSNFYMTRNSPKIKKAFLQYKRFGKTAYFPYSPPKTPPRQPPCRCVGPRAADLPLPHLLPPLWPLPTVGLFIGLPMQRVLVSLWVIVDLQG